MAMKKLYDALRASQKAIRQLREQGAPIAFWDDVERANKEALSAAANHRPSGIAKIEFHVGAAKSYDDCEDGFGQPNWSYLNSFPSFAEAEADWNKYCSSYPITEFYLEITFMNGVRERTDVHTGGRYHLVDGHWVDREFV